MLWQLHHQFKDGHTEFVSQIELGEDRNYNNDITRRAIDEAWKNNPPPDGATFVIGNEEWENFVQIDKKEEIMVEEHGLRSDDVVMLKILEAFGLRNVKKFTLEAEIDKLVTMTIVHEVTGPGPMYEVVELIKKYKLVEKVNE
jgi:hypothetical protein